MSKTIYCTAAFKPKEGKARELFETLQRLEPNTLREEGCLYYRVTRHIPHHPFADGQSYPIVFHEAWRDDASFRAHCQRQEIVSFFQRHCLSPDGLVEAYNVTVYTDEPEAYDAPVL